MDNSSFSADQEEVNTFPPLFFNVYKNIKFSYVISQSYDDILK